MASPCHPCLPECTFSTGPQTPCARSLFAFSCVPWCQALWSWGLLVRSTPVSFHADQGLVQEGDVSHSYFFLSKSGTADLIWSCAYAWSKCPKWHRALDIWMPELAEAGSQLTSKRSYLHFFSVFLSLAGWTCHPACSSSQVYKLLYASRLADYGLASQALHYCEAIGAAVLSQGQSSHPVLLVELIKVSVSKGSLQVCYLQCSEKASVE